MPRLVLALLLVAACGGDDVVTEVPDAAPPDAEVPDAQVDRCLQLCSCATDFCAAEFPDMATCMTDCATLDESIKGCRIEHCGYAMTNPTLHCDHVEGDPAAPTPMCVAQ